MVSYPVKIDNRINEKSDWVNVSDLQLVRLCLENTRSAWEEFFRRFIPDIKHAIKNKLKDRGRLDLCYDQDVIANIHEKIVVKLYKHGALKQCVKPSGIRQWLKTVAGNQTLDWLKEKSRKKRLPQNQFEKSLISLSKPLNGKDGLTVEDTIADSSDTWTEAEQNQIREYIKISLEQIGGIQDEKKHWVIRLSIIRYLPLSNEETEKLAKFSGCTVSTLKKQLNEIVLKLRKKEENRLKALGRAILLWHEIRRLEAVLADKEKDLLPGNGQSVENIIQQIKNKSENREDLLDKGKKLPRPSNRDIADIVGLAENQINQISNILVRARKRILKNMDFH